MRESCTMKASSSLGLSSIAASRMRNSDSVLKSAWQPSQKELTKRANSARFRFWSESASKTSMACNQKRLLRLTLVPCINPDLVASSFKHQCASEHKRTSTTSLLNEGISDFAFQVGTACTYMNTTGCGPMHVSCTGNVRPKQIQHCGLNWVCRSPAQA